MTGPTNIHLLKKTPETLGTALPQELIRVRRLLCEYWSLGQPGALSVLLIERLLQSADKAMVEQDLPAMIAVWMELKEVQ